MIGETVKDFTITARLGKGGMGEVFAAEQRIVKTKVAIKMLLGEISQDTSHVQRFFNEAIAVSKIHHAGIVKIFDVGFQPDGRAYLIMELLEGESLATRIARAGRLPPAEVLELARQITSVLDATHAADIIHRDLKPDNIFVVPDREHASGERVKILDFGIAKLGTTTGMTAAASAMGTPAYMAPEQWSDAKTAGARADVYSLGCLIFEMCCGRPPFVATTIGEACSKHQSETPPRARTLALETPVELDDLIARMLAKAPDDRPSMAEVAAGLARPMGSAATAPTMAGPPATARTLGAGEPPRRSRRLLAILGVLTVAAAGVGFLVIQGKFTKPTIIVTPTITHYVDAATNVAREEPKAAPDALAPVAQASAHGLTISYRVIGKLPDVEAFHPLAPNEALPSRGSMAFEVELSEPAHLFIFQRTKSTKELVVLFPSDKIAIPNPLPGGTWVRIPEHKAFHLDDKDLGTETVYLVASRTPLADLERAITGERATPARGIAVADQLVVVATAKRPDCDATHRALTLDDDCATKPRGLVLDEPARGTEAPSRKVRALTDDDAVVVPFSFQHVK